MRGFVRRLLAGGVRVAFNSPPPRARLSVGTGVMYSTGTGVVCCGSLTAAKAWRVRRQPKMDNKG